MGRARAVSVVIPAFNEETRIGGTVRAAFRLPGVAEVWVVDDGSADGTAAAARQHGAQVLPLPRNVGKGRALMYGLAVARHEVVALLDADLGGTAAGVEPLVEAVAAGGADLAIGHIGAEGSSRGWGWVKRLAALGLYCRCRRWFASPLSGQRALRKSALPYLLPFASGWGVEVAMTWDAMRAGLKVVEIPITVRHRATGRDWPGIRHRARQLKDIVAALAGRRIPGDAIPGELQPRPGL